LGNPAKEERARAILGRFPFTFTFGPINNA